MIDSRDREVNIFAFHPLTGTRHIFKEVCDVVEVDSAIGRLKRQVQEFIYEACTGQKMPWGVILYSSGVFSPETTVRRGA